MMGGGRERERERERARRACPLLLSKVRVRVLSQVCSNVILVAKNGYVEILSVAVSSS
jgi:hypothetical protein